MKVKQDDPSFSLAIVYSDRDTPMLLLTNLSVNTPHDIRCDVRSCVIIA